MRGKDLLQDEASMVFVHHAPSSQDVQILECLGKSRGSHSRRIAVPETFVRPRREKATTRKPAIRSFGIFEPPPPLEDRRLVALSLGAGVQSTTLALMAAHGEIEPMPDLAIFADTGEEPAAVYEHLRWLMSGNVLPFPVKIVSRGNLGDEIEAAASGTQRNDARPPFFIRNPDGSCGVLRRQCTGDYKVDVVVQAIRAEIDLAKGQRGPARPVVEQWIGISTDEIVRIKDARAKYIRNRWPLIEKRMSRRDCEAWLRRHGYPIPAKSACVFCPYRDNGQWRWLRDNDPAGWTRAVEIDRALRTPGYVGLVGEAYVHRSLVPLDEVDLSAPESGGLLSMLDECDGMCGV